MILVTDLWSGVHVDESVVNNPSEADVVEAIKRLDQTRYSMIRLEQGEYKDLAVGGGKGDYVVFTTVADMKFFNLVRPGVSDTEMKLLEIGGQEGDFALDHIVTEDMAIACALTYLKDGSMDSRFTWQEQYPEE